MNASAISNANADRVSSGERQRFAQEVLGPIIHKYLFQLHSYMLYHDGPDSVHLFCARAGVRIAQLYDLYVQASGGPRVLRSDLFWMSRLMVAKGAFRRTPAAMAGYIASEFPYGKISDVVLALLRHRPDLREKMHGELDRLDAPAVQFEAALQWDMTWARVVQDYLDETSRDFDIYFRELIKKRDKVILIDSGWQGSAQSLLANAYPDLDFMGLYFGRTFMGRQVARHVPNIVGVMFENDAFAPDVPESAFTLHRHLIESLFEPNGPSIEEVADVGKLGLLQAQMNRDEIIDPVHDAHFCGVRAYLAEHAAKGSAASILARHDRAMEKLAEMLVTPTARDVGLLRTKDRSQDFGRTGIVPVVLDGEKYAALPVAERIKRSLWTQGQIALEYTSAQAREFQLGSVGLTAGGRVFGSRASPSGVSDDALERCADESGERGRVAIITRTKNRPLLLERAARSVAQQNYDNYVWVVVNDGGSEAPVIDVIKKSAVDPKKIILISNASSAGMEAASNIGIRRSASEFIVIHDDDDSWDAEFLSETVELLQSREKQVYGGIITGSIYVSEEIRGTEVIEHSRTPYKDWVRNVHLSEMACENMFPPIAFLFRRSVYDKIGGFDERLPVLGDWAFNLAFLLETDIAVLRKPLALYHHRDRGEDRGVYANSVIGGRNKHEEFNSVVRNEFIRKAATGNPAGIALALGYMTNELRDQFSRRQHSGGTVSAMSPPSSEPPPQVMDALDRRWVSMQILSALASGRLLWLKLRFPLKKLPPVSHNMVWSDAIKYLDFVEISVPDDFDEAAYLIQNPDVRQAVDTRKSQSGYLHYVKYGRVEGRKRPTIL